MSAAVGPAKTLESRRFKFISATEKCFDADRCPYDQQLHFHCDMNVRCHFATAYAPAMDRHMTDFHAIATTGLSDGRLPQTFDFFDQSYDCGVTDCVSNKMRSHFHCARCSCAFSVNTDVSTHVCGQQLSDNRNNAMAEQRQSPNIDDSDSDGGKASPNRRQPTNNMTSPTLSSHSVGQLLAAAAATIVDDMEIEPATHVDGERGVIRSTNCGSSRMIDGTDMNADVVIKTESNAAYADGNMDMCASGTGLAMVTSDDERVSGK